MPRPRLVIALIALALAAFAVPTVGADDLLQSPPDTSIYSAPGAFTGGYVEVEFRGSEGAIDDTHTANPVDHIECRLDAGDWTPCDGPWILTDVPEGQHEILGRAVDTTGLADPTPAVVDFFTDRTGPLGEVTINDGVPVAGRYLVRLRTSASDVSPVDELLVSNSPAVDANGVLSQARQVQVPLIGTGLDWSLDDSGSGGSHVPGMHSVYVQYQDAQFNWGPIAHASIDVDPSQTPAVRIRLSASQNPAPVGGRVDVRAYAEVADGSAITDGRLQLELVVPGGPLIDIAPSSVATSNGAWVTSSALPAGTYKALASFGGSADLPDAQTSIELTVGPSRDTVPPHVAFGPPSPYPFDDVTSFSLPVLSVPVEATSFQCRLDGGPWTPCGPSYEVSGFANGWHEVELRGADRAGNWSEPLPFWFHHGPRSDGTVQLPEPDSINNPAVTVYESPPSGATGLRASNSASVDGDGRLSMGEDLGLPLSQMFVWDLTDPAYGGTPTDGYKTAYVEWQLPDGSWTELLPFGDHLDRHAPSVSLSIEQGSAFADQDHLFVLARSDGDAEVTIAGSPATLLPPLRGAASGGGLSFLTWPIGDVPIGSVVTEHLYAVATDAAGNRSPVVEASIVIDRSNPTSAFARPSFVVGGRVSTTYVPIRLTVTSSDTGSGVGTSYLQQLSGSVGHTVATAHSASVSFTASVGYTSTRYWRAWAVDRLGHRGAYVLGPAVRPVIREETTHAITYHGRWALSYSGSALGHEVMRTTAAGATATFTMTGRAAAIVAPRGPGRGKAAVYVDGQYVLTIDLGSSTYHPATIVFGISWSTSGRHLITIRALGTHGRPAVDVDAVVSLP